jgi:hypothetical protein
MPFGEAQVRAGGGERGILPGAAPLVSADSRSRKPFGFAVGRVSLNKAGHFRQLPVRVLNFEQTAAVNWLRLRNNGGDDTRSLIIRRLPMSKADQFRQYAEEAIRWAFQSKTEKERQASIELGRTWMQAALHSEHTFGVNDSPPEARAL